MLCYIIKANQVRGVAQVVAHQTGGLGVASSSLVTPTKKQDTDWYPAFFMQSARLELANEFPNG